MKRSIAVAVFAAFFCSLFGGNVFALSVEEEIELLKKDIAQVKAEQSDKSAVESLLDAMGGFAFEAGGTIVMQGVSKVNDGSDDARLDATYSVDFGIGKEFSNGATAFMKFEAGAGDGLDDSVFSYGGLNGDAGNSEDKAEISEFWYEQPLFDDKVTVTFGKLSPTEYFDENEYANDENTQFLAPMFVNNSVIAFTDNNLGMRLTYSPSEKIDITYAHMTGGWSRMDTKGFNAIQLTFKPSDGANYRFMGWASNEDLEKFEDGEIKGGYGFALSLDQSLSDNFGLFARFGYADKKVYELSASWSIGAQIKGEGWSRENDTIGIAVGQLIPSKDFTDAEGIKDDSETQAELYYSFAIGENLFITPSLQYVSKPLGANAATDDNLFVYGIRTHIAF